MRHLHPGPASKGHMRSVCRHARKHFSQAEGSQLDEVRQAMGMLAFPPDTHISPYKVSPPLSSEEGSGNILVHVPTVPSLFFIGSQLYWVCPPALDGLCALIGFWPFSGRAIAGQGQ